LAFLVKTIPDLEKQCKLEGQCAKDLWIVDGLAKKAYNDTAAGDWNATDKDVRDMMEEL